MLAELRQYVRPVGPVVKLQGPAVVDTMLAAIKAAERLPRYAAAERRRKAR